MRPIFTIPIHACALASRASRRAVTDGMRRSSISAATAMWSAVGNVSFDDWLMFTWSFGWIGALPPRDPVASSLARPAITSLTFMFDWVPEPVCQTRSGNSPARVPSTTSPAARTTRSRLSGGSRPRSAFTSAAARLRMPKARTIGTGIVSRLIAKWWRERWVWAPQ